MFCITHCRGTLGLRDLLLSADLDPTLADLGRLLRDPDLSRLLRDPDLSLDLSMDRARSRDFERGRDGDCDVLPPGLQGSLLKYNI